MNQYLIKDFSEMKKTNDHDDIKYRVVNEDELWSILQDAKDNKNLLISVYRLGECVLDWS